MKSGLIYISFSFFYGSHSVLLEKIIHTEQDFYTLLWVSMNARFLFRPSISKGAGGRGGGRSWQTFWSKIPEPKPLVLLLLLVGSVYLTLSQMLAHRVACSIVVVSFKVRALVFLHYLCYINNKTN